MDNPTPQVGAKGARWGRANPETYVEADIGGQNHLCLVDTGCDHSLLPGKMVPDVVLQPAQVAVFAANGSVINILGSTSMNFSIQGIALTADLLVTEDIDEIMLGYDWLVSQKARWHFDEKVMLLHGMTVNLKVRPSRKHCRRVYVRERISIPPNTEMNVPVKLVRESFRTPTASWVVGPATLAAHVFAARVLLPDEDEYASVRILNPSDKDFLLKEGHSMGCASMGMEVESQQALLPVDRVDVRPTGCLPTGPHQNIVKTCTVTCVEPDLSYLQPVVDSLPESLSEEQREEAIKLVYDFKDVFSKHDYDLGRTDLIEHVIETGDARPVREALRKQPQVHLSVIDAEVEKMAASGVIEPSYSPWASNIVVVTKHDKPLG